MQTRAVCRKTYRSFILPKLKTPALSIWCLLYNKTLLKKMKDPTVRFRYLVGSLCCKALSLDAEPLRCDDLRGLLSIETGSDQSIVGLLQDLCHDREQLIVGFHLFQQFL